MSLSSVIATMRDLKKKDKLVEAAGDTYGKTLMLLPLDVCSDESVKQCINNVKDRHIDILSEFDIPGNRSECTPPLLEEFKT